MPWRSGQVRTLGGNKVKILDWWLDFWRWVATVLLLAVLLLLAASFGFGVGVGSCWALTQLKTSGTALWISGGAGAMLTGLVPFVTFSEDRPRLRWIAVVVGVLGWLCGILLAAWLGFGFFPWPI